ncbi:MAG TPA: ribosome biogenesis GTP-binding protein YihA/YsxC [Polyangia bacterium]
MPHDRASDVAIQVQVHAAAFVAETRTLASLPPVGPPEIAIAGRSNVGKSTLLNRLAGRHKLARTSKTPGRTRGIVFYDLRVGAGPGVGPREVRLADLPGFGYAQVSQAERVSWQPLIEGYTERRPTLALFVVLVDARRGLAAEETQLLEWLATLVVPVQLVFTKVDKLSASERGALRASLRASAPARRPLFVSGQTGDGVEELWGVILRSLPGAASPPTEIAGRQEPA